MEVHMNYKDYFNLLKSHNMISSIWLPILEMIEIDIKHLNHYNEYLILFTLYFSLIDDGNIAMSLNKDILMNKWLTKVTGAQILSEEQSEDLDNDFITIIEIANDAMDYCADINAQTLPILMGSNHIFMVEDDWLYVKKYYQARLGLKDSLKRLFNYRSEAITTFDYKDCVNDYYRLSQGQERAVNEGFKKNLIITGGPGTGKTTSILFLLLNLLDNKSVNYEVYLTAPSGKASSRMKESIIKNLNDLKDTYKESHQDLINRINSLEESTIHRLLGLDAKNNEFKHNKNNQFAQNSIFIIDEASMIDINIFDALLEAIPTGARVFIMGDKNQLPSVECGAVFGELINANDLKDNVVALDESRRFSANTHIYELAEAINNDRPLPVKETDWQDYTTFKIQPDDDTDPVFYYNIQKNGVKDKDILEKVLKIWGKEYFAKLQKEATSLSTDSSDLDKLFKKTEIAKILCAENQGVRGVKMVNDFIKKECIDMTQLTSVQGHFAGEIMMINKNNKALDLYNGDSGILVTFKDDATLYFMAKKASNLISQDGKVNDKIFKLGEFVFYPLRLLAQSDIDLAYAITIHKSQGSDYKNILVILPTKKGHPLLNRQIIYTAITRTKGNTYILSQQEYLEEAAHTVLIRDTNIA